jgi:hypothetical protein
MGRLRCEYCRKSDLPPSACAFAPEKCIACGGKVPQYWLSPSGKKQPVDKKADNPNKKGHRLTWNTQVEDVCEFFKTLPPDTCSPGKPNAAMLGRTAVFEPASQRESSLRRELPMDAFAATDERCEDESPALPQKPVVPPPTPPPAQPVFRRGRLHFAPPASEANKLLRFPNVNSQCAGKSGYAQILVRSAFASMAAVSSKYHGRRQQAILMQRWKSETHRARIMARSAITTIVHVLNRSAVHARRRIGFERLKRGGVSVPMPAGTARLLDLADPVSQSVARQLGQSTPVDASSHKIHQVHQSQQSQQSHQTHQTHHSHHSHQTYQTHPSTSPSLCKSGVGLSAAQGSSSPRPLQVRSMAANNAPAPLQV